MKDDDEMDAPWPPPVDKSGVLTGIYFFLIIAGAVAYVVYTWVTQ